MYLKHELQNIISGNGFVRYGKNIQTITNYLGGKKETVSNFKEYQFNKNEETKILTDFIGKSDLWFTEIDSAKYIGEGAEQRIYEFEDPNFVLKLNDCVFYASWFDYLNNLLIHNCFFPHLAYELIGFKLVDEKLNAIVKQPFVKATENTNLQNVKDFLSENGFINKKDNDYFHPSLGIILKIYMMKMY